MVGEDAEKNLNLILHITIKLMSGMGWGFFPRRLRGGLRKAYGGVSKHMKTS